MAKKAQSNTKLTIEGFIQTKPELKRYSMSVQFKKYCIMNTWKYNNFRDESDYEKAYKDFYR